MRRSGEALHKVFEAVRPFILSGFPDWSAGCNPKKKRKEPDCLHARLPPHAGSERDRIFVGGATVVLAKVRRAIRSEGPRHDGADLGCV